MDRTATSRVFYPERQTLLCPRCEKEQPVRSFLALGMNPSYADMLTPIYRCKLCNHIFAPRLDAVPETSASASGRGEDRASH